eukprot:scaffold16655_cov19-Tisochrysis_lutea.AAC.1
MEQAAKVCSHVWVLIANDKQRAVLPKWKPCSIWMPCTGTNMLANYKYVHIQLGAFHCCALPSVISSTLQHHELSNAAFLSATAFAAASSLGQCCLELAATPLLHPASHLDPPHPLPNGTGYQPSAPPHSLQ